MKKQRQNPGDQFLTRISHDTLWVEGFIYQSTWTLPSCSPRVHEVGQIGQRVFLDPALMD